MGQSVVLVRVFLASPSDLGDERRKAYESVTEINKSIASHLGFIVDLVGWEDTLSGMGRPQETINKDLDSCELFIGLIYKKWGTVPSNEGVYTSGFEEEFERSLLKYKSTGKPEMAMYFKKVSSDFLQDPGEDLQKVLSFQENIIKKKEILYESFDNSYSFQECIRKKITSYLFELKSKLSDEIEAGLSKTKPRNEKQDLTVIQKRKTSPISKESQDFLIEFMKKSDHLEIESDYSSLDVARFRLLSSTIYHSGNDDISLGVHDANIIYNNKNVKFSNKEINSLIDSGLRNIKHETVPLWHWLKKYKPALHFKTLTGSNDNCAIGAFEAMCVISHVIPANIEHLERSYFLDDWFSDEATNLRKLAALKYLKFNGVEEDISWIDIELNKNDINTTSASIEAILSILLRYNKKLAFEYAYKNQFKNIEISLLNEIFDTPFSVDNNFISNALIHSNYIVRSNAIKHIGIDNISSSDLENLKNDPSPAIRYRVISYLKSQNPHLSDADVKSILVKPTNNNSFRGLSPLGLDDDGKGYFDKYLFLEYRKQSETHLLSKISATILDLNVYIAMCYTYFKNHSTKLRSNIDDEFEQEFENLIQVISNIDHSEESIQKWHDLKTHLKRSAIFEGIKVLCDKALKEDLYRIRLYSRKNKFDHSVNEIIYLGKYGEWEDIPFIVKLNKHHSSSILANDADRISSIANSIYRIGNSRFEELFKLEMPSAVLVKLIKISATTKFSKLSDTILISLLDNENDNIRKATSLKIIAVFSKSKTSELLDLYLENGRYHYYNVVHWLDLGISSSKQVLKRAVNYIE